MRVDYLWRYDSSQYYMNDIELAVEHENVTAKLSDLIEGEIQHLIDLKARNKVGIFYIAQGDEEDFVKAVGERIRMQGMRSQLERYLIILGSTTSREKRRALLFKGCFFAADGSLTNQQHQVIFQAS
ncbi:MAG: hypothetical protein ACE5IG_06375 [Dehalococcoidia bacterium]